MGDWLHSPVPLLLLTLGCYRFGLWLYVRCHRHPLLHPLLVGGVPLVLGLWWIEIPYARYLENTALLQLLLGPATVALAWPLYRQLRTIRSVWWPVVWTTVIGAILAASMAVGIAWQLEAPVDLLASLATKSVTTPIAIDTATLIGGSAPAAAGIVALTGIVAALAAPLLFRILGITDDRVRGFTLGLTGHAIGTARAFEYSERAGAFAGLALGLTGLLTALLLPWLWPLWFT